MPSEFANPRRHRAVVEDGAYTTYRYYNADVLKVSKCRSHMVLSDGGVRSVGTKNAVNDALAAAGIPLVVYQQNYTWKVKRTLHTFHAFVVRRFQNGVPLKLV